MADNISSQRTWMLLMLLHSSCMFCPGPWAFLVCRLSYTPERSCTPGPSNVWGWVLLQQELSEGTQGRTEWSSFKGIPGVWRTQWETLIVQGFLNAMHFVPFPFCSFLLSWPGFDNGRIERTAWMAAFAGLGCLWPYFSNNSKSFPSLHLFHSPRRILLVPKEILCRTCSHHIYTETHTPMHTHTQVFLISVEAVSASSDFELKQSSMTTWIV